jgi:hypothetical protein
VAAVVPATRRIEFVLVEQSTSEAAARPGSALTPMDEYPRIPLRGKKPASLGRKPENGKQVAPGRSQGRPAGKKRR